MSYTTPTTGIQAALDLALARIQELHPNVPSALAVVLSTGRGKFHGSFQASSWLDNAGESAGSARHEIVMGTESLARGADLTLTTLIHECVHALAHATEQKDTSSGGRYHNNTFRILATTMGLITETRPDKTNVHTVGLMDQTKHDYKDVLETLSIALTTARKPVEKVKAPKTTVRIACACDVAVTVPIKWFDNHGADTLECSDCGSNYAAID